VSPGIPDFDQLHIVGQLDRATHRLRVVADQTTFGVNAVIVAFRVVGGCADDLAIAQAALDFLGYERRIFGVLDAFRRSACQVHQSFVHIA